MTLSKVARNSSPSFGAPVAAAILPPGICGNERQEAAECSLLQPQGSHDPLRGFQPIQGSFHGFIPWFPRLLQKRGFHALPPRFPRLQSVKTTATWFPRFDSRAVYHEPLDNVALSSLNIFRSSSYLRLRQYGQDSDRDLRPDH